MITRQEAVDVLKARSRWEPEEYGDGWESTEEIERMRVWLRREFDRLFADSWEEPAETPCGWLFPKTYVQYPHLEDSFMSFGADHDWGWVLVNLWTAEVTDKNKIYSGCFLPTEAILRLYIDRLPAEQHAESLLRIDLLPYEPVRSYPPILKHDVQQREGLSPRTFVMEMDLQFFNDRRLPLPYLIVGEVVGIGPGEVVTVGGPVTAVHPDKDWYGNDALRLGLFHTEHRDAVRVTREWSKGGKVCREYSFSLPPRERRTNVSLKLRFSHVPPESSRWVEEHAWRLVPNLDFPWE